MAPSNHSPLLTSVSQFEVDFVIPRIGVDLPLGIDPFLLFKSRDPDLAALHQTLMQAFNAGIDALRRDQIDEARYLLDFPEVSEIGLGNTKKGKRGTGVGTFLTELILETLNASPDLMERGIRHVEEMQLVSVGIGPDRVSDIAANLLKHYLIEYTQKQCAIWAIPMTKGVPVSHVFDPETGAWNDAYYDLPLNPVDSSAVLLVPRRLVRALPWINYGDFLKQEFSAFLRAKRVRQILEHSQGTKSLSPLAIKQEVVAISRAEVERVESYVHRKESEAAKAQPSQTYLVQAQECGEAEELKRQIESIPTGPANAALYQRTVLAILNYLFAPELIDGELEVRTIDGTERRDIVFTNDSDQTFWSYLRTEHSSLLLMFEIKNTDDPGMASLNQTATYLGDRLGRMGFIVTRKPAGEGLRRKAFSVYNDSQPRKVVLILSDADLSLMLEQRCKGQDPMRHIQKMYRSFRTTVQ